jgi:hypothetical protein
MKCTEVIFDVVKSNLTTDYKYLHILCWTGILNLATEVFHKLNCNLPSEYFVFISHVDYYNLEMFQSYKIFVSAMNVIKII